MSVRGSHSTDPMEPWAVASPAPPRLLLFLVISLGPFPGEGIDGEPYAVFPRHRAFAFVWVVATKTEFAETP